MTLESPKAAALLVGINAYRSAPLRGCVPDILSMDRLLTNYGVQNIKTLLDKEATKDAILRGLLWLSAQGAETAYFVFSGHGTRVEDVDGDEARQNSGTTYDQAICPIDYQKAGFILDDELAERWSLFPMRTKLIVQLDSCFSAKSERGFIGKQIDRYLKWREPRVLPHKLAAKAPKPEKKKAVLPRRQHMILLSGCRDFETSADAYLGGEYRGAMTYFIQQSLARLGPTTNWRDVLEDARRELEKQGFAQIPQLSGPAGWLSKPMFT